MKKNQKKLIAIIGLCTLGLFIYSVIWPYLLYLSVPSFSTGQYISSGWLLIRTKTPDDHSILFRFLENDEVYRYRDNLLGPAAENPKPIMGIASSGEGPQLIEGRYWDSATGPISDCLHQVAGPSGRFEWKKQELLHDGRSVNYAGKSLWQRAVSPDGEHFAVLSAQGRARYFGLPFLGGESASGARIHQVFRQSDGKLVGEPVILKDAGNDDFCRPCWTPDGRMIIYTDHELRRIWVVPFADNSENGKS